MKNNNYKKTVAEGEAEWLWKLYGITKPDELILEDVAFARGVIVTEGPLEKMEARLVRIGDKGLIRIRQDIPNRGQKRFAIAHELGHWQLHEKISQFFACTSDDMVASYKTSFQEGEANIFAAGLLMPSDLFLSVAENQTFCFKAISELAKYFITSLTATAIRYVDLSNDYCAIICSEAGKIRWWRGSDSFENVFWLSVGSKLTTNTVAGSFFIKGTKPIGPEEVDIDAWSERKGHTTSETFIEESIYIERYKQILSFLRLP
jgi:Zn-dependent peptidase ImmA (M78 family)